MADDEAKRTQAEELERKRALRAQYPSDMGFFAFSHKFTSEDEPLKAAWLPDYYSDRGTLRFEKRDVPREIRALLKRLGADASDSADRYRGVLLGSLLGDSLGMPVEGLPRDQLIVAGLEGGGPYQLEKGDWTDATSMSSCVAYSLIKSRGFDAAHQLTCLSYWYRYGAYSVQEATALAVGPSVERAIQAFLRSGDPEASAAEPPSAGNGSLTRLAPVILFYFDDFEACMAYAERSSRLTHRAPEAVDACRYLGALLFGALRGEDKATLLGPHYSPVAGYWERRPLCPAIEAIALGDYKHKARALIPSSAYAAHTLEAALWAFHHTDDFKAGALEAVNLAGDADATGAVFGALAGAHYGEMRLPIDWIRWVVYSPGFYHFAQELLPLSIAAQRARPRQ